MRRPPWAIAYPAGPSHTDLSQANPEPTPMTTTTIASPPPNGAPSAHALPPDDEEAGGLGSIAGEPSETDRLVWAGQDGVPQVIVSKPKRGRPRKDATSVTNEQRPAIRKAAAPIVHDDGAASFAKLQAAAEEASEAAEAAHIALVEAAQARRDEIRTELAELDALLATETGNSASYLEHIASLPTAIPSKRHTKLAKAKAVAIASPAPKAKRAARKSKAAGPGIDHSPAILAALKKVGKEGAPVSALADVLGIAKPVIASHLQVLRIGKKVKMSGKNRGAVWALAH
jgi:hypothetical protein